MWTVSRCAFASTWMPGPTTSVSRWWARTTSMRCCRRPGSSRPRCSSFRSAGLQTRLHRVAAELAKGVAGDPPGGSGIGPPDLLGGQDGPGVELRAALADLPQRPGDRLLHVVAVVGRLLADHGQQGCERSE